MDLRKWAVGALLVLHVMWIANHMRLVAQDQINPWRLGGYAMYTVPPPGYRVRVYEAGFPDQPLRVNHLQYEAAIWFTNPGRTFRCADIPTAALRSFFNENPDLIGRSLIFVHSERRFVRVPPSTKRQVQALVQVNWQDAQSFTYTTKICGKEGSQSATLP
ncbi:MAG: hypothetical protein AB7F09_11345 [Parvibaculaceae bacterium]